MEMQIDPNTQNEKLIFGLKKLVLLECNVQGVLPGEIADLDQIINGNGALKLDSLDAVEIVAAIEREFVLKFESANSSRILFKNFQTMADYISKNAAPEKINQFIVEFGNSSSS